jgi:four helix bundle protein
MSKTAYENLEIYVIAEAVAHAAWKAVARWPAFEKRTTGMQLVRAADSIGANIAEGFGRGNGADQKRFLRIARGSVYETKHWLRLAFARSMLIDEDVQRLRPLMDKLPPKLNAYMKAVTRRRVSTIDAPQSTFE